MTSIAGQKQPVTASRRSPAAWLLLSPLLVALGVWVYGPVLATVLLSFAQWSLTGPPPEFVGIDNFRHLITSPDFGRSALQTLLYAAALLPFSTVIPGALALLMWIRPGRAALAYRALIFLPFMVAPVTLAVAWQFLLNPLEGLVGDLTAAVGLPRINWLSDPSTAFLAIVLITAAKVVAFNMLLLTASLERVDRRLLDAARIEGASGWQAVRFVVLPQLIRPLVSIALLSLLLAGQWVFVNVSVLTQGGPDGATNNIYYLIYTDAFRFFATGRASAAGVLVLVVVLGALVVAAVAQRRRRAID